MPDVQPRRLQTVLPQPTSVLLRDLEEKLCLPTRSVLILAVQALHTQHFTTSAPRGRPKVSETLNPEPDDGRVEEARAYIAERLEHYTMPRVADPQNPTKDPRDLLTGRYLPLDHDYALIVACAEAVHHRKLPLPTEHERLRAGIDERRADERAFNEQMEACNGRKADPLPKWADTADPWRRQKAYD